MVRNNNARQPRNNTIAGNVLIDIQKDLYLDDLAPLNNGTIPKNVAQNRISLVVSGACSKQTNDLEQRIVEIITDWKKTLREDE